MRSDTVKRGFERAPHRSLLKATGAIQSDGDFEKPFIGICNSYLDLIPGHVHLHEFGQVAKAAVREAGGVPYEFNTTAIDLTAGRISLLVSDADLARRLRRLPPFEPKIKGGYLERYSYFVTSASQGAVLRRPGAASSSANGHANGHHDAHANGHLKYGNSFQVF